jgi:SAM-dependent methyltransferase
LSSSLSVQDEYLRRMSGAPRYNAWLLERALPHLGPRVIDVGAGIGIFVAQLLPTCELVVAVEPDPTDAEIMRGRFAGEPRVRVEERDAISLEQADVGGPFDAAICFNVLEHIDDDVRALRAIRSQLGVGGRLCLLVPAHEALFGTIDRNVGHARRYDRATLRARFEAADLVALETRYVNPLGALGWLLSSRVLRREHVPEAPLKAYDKLVPLLRAADRLPLPFGLSVWAVAERRA